MKSLNPLEEIMARKTTYMIENSKTHEVIEYCSTAYVAKSLLVKLATKRPIEHKAKHIRMVKLVGPSFGEGDYIYLCQYDGMKQRFVYNRNPVFDRNSWTWG